MMKKLTILCLWVTMLLPALAFGQSYVNPDTIYQSGNIILQNTDVYYCPFAPPDSMETREGLCAEADQILDPNGVGNFWRIYTPVLRDTAVWHDSVLSGAHPCGSGRVLGPNVVWQRLFTARNKPDGSPSDIIVGSNVDTTHSVSVGMVTISKNEDVDFRASGTIKFEPGVHGMPGAFVHAYIEPKYDSILFSDEFSDTAIFNSQWYVTNAWQDDYPAFNECSKDTDVRIVHDSDAHDGYALDIMLREDTVDTCNCGQVYNQYSDSCVQHIDTNQSIHKSFFYSAILRACPFPNQSASLPLRPAWQQAPYGKYEMRDKVPHVLHNTNNWGGGEGTEWDLGETNNAVMGMIDPGFSHQRVYGPCQGYFVKQATDTLFISSNAGWCLHNQPTELIIDNFIYPVTPFDDTLMKDTVVATGRTILQGGFPSSLVNSANPFTFYYMHSSKAIADSVTWTVSTDGKRTFNAPYADSSGTLLYFSKNYQPVSITLTTDHAGDKKTFPCQWDQALNSVIIDPDSSVDSLLSTDLHTNTEAYQYTIPDLYSGSYGYPSAPIEIDRDTNANDQEGIDSTPYRYHTFAMEFLPHEVRFLVDSNVVRRWPDHLIPPGNPYYDWITTQPRSMLTIHPGEFDMDNNSKNADPFGGDDTSGYWMGWLGYNSITYEERHYFETHPHNPGCWDVNGQHAAHHLLDYVKVWDVPKDVKIPDYPH